MMTSTNERSNSSSSNKYMMYLIKASLLFFFSLPYAIFIRHSSLIYISIRCATLHCVVSVFVCVSHQLSSMSLSSELILRLFFAPLNDLSLAKQTAKKLSSISWLILTQQICKWPRISCIELSDFFKHPKLQFKSKLNYCMNGEDVLVGTISSLCPEK